MISFFKCAVFFISSKKTLYLTDRKRRYILQLHNSVHGGEGVTCFVFSLLCMDVSRCVFKFLSEL